jgi:hypothetical protein
VSGDDEHDDTRARLTLLFAVADEAIDAHIDVFPAAVWVRDDGTVAKSPLTRNGHLDAHQDRQRIRQELITPPHIPSGVPDDYETVVAIVPGSGHKGVLDCDVKHGAAGHEALVALVRQYGEFYKAVWSTPSGGANILFEKPLGASYGNTSPWPGIDVRADAGWVVAPGNVCSAGAWQWKVGNYSTTDLLPGAITDQLTAATVHGPKASNAETVQFVDEHSGIDTTMPAMQWFDRALTQFRSSRIGSRHEALRTIVGGVCGMNSMGPALDVRWAIEKIKVEWQHLTAGEGREDEVTDLLTWTVGQEVRQRAAAAVAAPVIDDYQPAHDDADIAIDWRAFALRDSTPQAWLVDRFWPAGRAMALWAKAKEGKSELALWCAARLAMGEHPWTGRTIEPVHVAYFDFEMTHDDLEERLDLFGFDLDRLDALHYALLPPLHALDEERGGIELLGWVKRWRAQAVIIDTFTGAVAGDENSADTVRAFTRHTGLRLKQSGIPYLRTDHAGKEPGKGPRGTSAKQQDVDVTWNLHRTKSGVVLSCAAGSRLGWVGPTLDLERVVDAQDGTVSYVLPVGTMMATVPHGTTAKMQELDDAGVPLDAGRPAAVAALKDAGVRPGRNAVISAALKARRERAERTAALSQGQLAAAPTATEVRDSGTDAGQQSDEVF